MHPDLGQADQPPSDRARYIAPVFLAVTAILVLVAEGLDPFAIWNLAPLLLTTFLLAKLEARSDAAERWRTWGFLAGVCLVSGGVHVAWLFDLGKMQTGSSTSALVFVFVPVHALIAGLVGSVVGAMCGKRLTWHSHPDAPGH